MKRRYLTILALAASLQAAYADDQAADQNQVPPPATLPAAPATLPADVQERVDLQKITLLTAGADEQGFQSLSQMFFTQLNSDEQTATTSGKFDVSSLFGADPTTDYLTVTAETPLSQQGDFNNLATLDGLVKASSVQFRLSLLGGGFPRIGAPLHPGAQHDTPFVWVATLDGKVGSQDHDYFDPTTLLQHTATTTPWQVGGSFAGLFGDGHASFSLSFDYQEYFQDGDTGEERSQCLTVDNCVTGFIGAPVLKHQGLLSGDLRWVGEINHHPIAAELKVTYDPIQDTEAVQVPIYYNTDDQGKLTGGLRLNWNSTDHVVTIGVFASTAFNLLQ